ncbi:hypothetical protein [Mobilicoccus caccae]|uniref:Uncharacterized protein n=1 Tax=Mobilicoccus caccae TaxID=1859295 RepID=A0ABQ6IYE8_9MICO|nr:hypothetical protein [Mobilicoccus caccae]GMA42426.1 hypothetical protein GCM10025883_44710 [Mobilicoccus caccae]
MDPQHAAVARAAEELRTVRHFQRVDTQEQDAYLRDLGALAAELALLMREAGVTWSAMCEEPGEMSSASCTS